jgi:hypothetical protein
MEKGSDFYRKFREYRKGFCQGIFYEEWRDDLIRG